MVICLDDDILDPIRLWYEASLPFKIVNAPCILGVELGYNMEENMRFEIEKIENETINLLYGEVYTIKDNVDDDSIVGTFRFIKPTAEKVCEWLNENIKEVELTPRDKIDLMVDKLYNPDDIIVENHNDWFFIIEMRDTSVLKRNIADELGIPVEKVHQEAIGMQRSIYKIHESCLN